MAYTTEIWFSEHGEQSIKLIGEHNSPIIKVAFSPDRKKVATLNDRGVIQVWDLSGHLVDSFPPGSNFPW